MHGLPMFVRPPLGPAHTSGSRSVNPHPRLALCLFCKIEQTQMQRRSSEPAAAQIQGVDPPSPVGAAERSPLTQSLDPSPNYFGKYHAHPKMSGDKDRIPNRRSQVPT